ncbi:hypothetical protein ACQV5M_19145, partial [Leptospira sp. SA-E8]|uniref:hypothetical protein n=1 Tax=Leptospira sp. SA-E8 TaxID=3422259 RepID=UPI003EBD6083
QEKTVPAGDRLSQPLSLEDLTFRQLFEKFGPLIDSENATPLLGFNTRAALQKAISQGRLPLQLIRPQGRKKTFLATRALAKYMAQMAEEVAM